VRRTVEELYYDSMAVAVRWAGRRLGPWAVPFASLPWTLCEVARRLGDYAYFRKLRAALPADLRRGCGPLRHFLRMIVHWQGSICARLLCDALGEPRYRARLRIEGTPPDRIAGWGERPFVFAFLHTGGFGMFRIWMRSWGYPVASFAAGSPVPMTRPVFRRAADAADRAAGVGDCPSTFSASDLRAMFRFLQPGRALAVALDGIAAGGPLSPVPVPGGTLHAKDGAVRFAAKTSAVLVPVCVRQEGFLRFAARFGEPVPEEFVRDGDPARANAELLRQLWAWVREDPCSITWSTLESLSPGDRGPRCGWP
jgi:lauroyl/myristoyl acyltransferase